MIDQALGQELHEQLISKRKRLQEEIDTLTNEGVRSDVFQEDETDAVDQHPADDASELFEREKNLSVRQTLQESLQAVDAALRKFDEGTYGTCDNCGREIPEKRLRALPEATLCITCQEEQERAAQGAPR